MPPRPPYRRSRAALQGHPESAKTVVIALVANVVIAIAKLISGIISGSSAMLAEAAHSLADASNEVLLGISLKRASVPPDEDHPLGHGRERFLWAFLAALASFLIGGCFSVGMAIHQLTHGETLHSTIAAWIVLGVAFVGDGISWIQSVRQARADAKRRGYDVWLHLRMSSDPTVRAVVLEDSAALVGLVIAALGLLFSHMMHSDKPDAIASMLIGFLMALTAVYLGRNLADFLVGKSLPPELLADIRRLFESEKAIREIVTLRAVYIGPEEVVVTAKVKPAADLTAEALSRAMDNLDHAIRKASPYVADVYIDVTSHRAAEIESEEQMR